MKKRKTAKAAKSPRKSSGIFRLILRILPLTAKVAPFGLAFVVVASILQAAANALQPYVNEYFIDSVNAAIGTASLPLLALAAFCGMKLIMLIMDAVANLGSQYLFSWTVQHKLTILLHQKISRLSALSFEDSDRLDEIEKAAEGGPSVGWLVANVVSVFTFYLPYFAISAWYLIRLKPLLVLSLLFVFLPVLISHYFRAKCYTQMQDELVPLRRKRNHYRRCICQRAFFRETRLLGAVHFFRSIYELGWQIHFQKERRLKGRVHLFEVSSALLTCCGYGGVLWLLFDVLLAGEITIGAFAAVFNAVGNLFDLMEELFQYHFGTMSEKAPSISSFLRFMDQPEISDGTGTADQSDITLRNVSFTYPSADHPALSDINLSIHAGETIAIVGENGAGKSTLVRLLSGLYPPTEGEVLLGGHPMESLRRDSRYAKTSAVFQHFQRYPLTLRRNIDISCPDQPPTDEALQTILAQAGVQADSGTYPDGLETMLGREYDGAEVSGGQWQRIAIARGLCRPHEIIFLDEPTAAIDPLEESRLYHSFAEISARKTAVLVTHRLGSARIADRIVVMEDGRIVEIGTHDELLAANGAYTRMFHAQAQWYEESVPAQ